MFETGHARIANHIKRNDILPLLIEFNGKGKATLWQIYCTALKIYYFFLPFNHYVKNGKESFP